MQRYPVTEISTSLTNVYPFSSLVHSIVVEIVTGQECWSLQKLRRTLQIGIVHIQKRFKLLGPVKRIRCFSSNLLRFFSSHKIMPIRFVQSPKT